MRRASKTKYTILGFLTIRPMSGYDMKKSMEKTTGNFWSESPGQLYPELKKLLKGKYIQCEDQTTEGGRPRKVYSITSKGKKMLKDWLKQPAEMPVARDEVFLKLFFGKNMPIAESIRHVERRLVKAKEVNNYFLWLQKHIDEEHNEVEDIPFWKIMLNHGFYIIKAEMEWCKDAIKNLKQLSKKVV